MGFKETLKYEKENMPDFQWKFEKFIFAFLAVLLGGALLTLVASLMLGFLLDEDRVFYLIPLFAWAGAAMTMTVLLVVKAMRVKAKLRVYHAEKIEKEFFEIDYAEAKRKLIEAKRITDNEFIINAESPFEGECETLPFERAEVIFIPYFRSGKILWNLAIKNEVDWVLVDVMDNAYYNFLRNNPKLVKNEKVFQLFCNDKAEFIRMLVRYNDPVRIEKLLK